MKIAPAILKNRMSHFEKSHLPFLKIAPAIFGPWCRGIGYWIFPKCQPWCHLKMEAILLHANVLRGIK